MIVFLDAGLELSCDTTAAILPLTYTLGKKWESDRSFSQIQRIFSTRLLFCAFVHWWCTVQYELGTSRIIAGNKDSADRLIN